MDEITEEYLKARLSRDYSVFKADSGAEYSAEIEMDLSAIPLTVACPHLPSNTKPVEEVQGIEIQQVVIGSCTNGRIEDLRMAAAVLKGHEVKRNIRCLIIPGSQEVYRQAIKEGLMDIFINAGAVITMPTCGPCLGGHCGVLAEGERAVSTTNRNFVGRMGHTKSEVYLAGPAVAAASAVKGSIAHPEQI